MFASIKNLIPEPRQADQPRHYVGRHRATEPAPAPTEAPERAESRTSESRTADEKAAV